MDEVKSKYLNLHIGKSYKIDIPYSSMKCVNAHIISIINDNENTIIVFKYYSPYKKCWFYRAEELEILDIYNEKK